MARDARGVMLRGACLFLMAALCGCGLAPQQRPAASYDLGPPRPAGAARVPIPVTLLVTDVAAPAWLEGNGIVYRLEYDNAARPQAYSGSRWVAPPAALLTQRLRSGFTGVASGVVTGAHGARADYALRVELEDFSQTFSAPDSSRVSLRARASLIRLADRSLAAQKVIVVEAPAPSADARGAVAALGRASDDAVDRLVDWTGEQLRQPRK